MGMWSILINQTLLEFALSESNWHNIGKWWSRFIPTVKALYSFLSSGSLELFKFLLFLRSWSFVFSLKFYELPHILPQIFFPPETADYHMLLAPWEPVWIQHLSLCTLINSLLVCLPLASYVPWDGNCENCNNALPVQWPKSCLVRRRNHS